MSGYLKIWPHSPVILIVDDQLHTLALLENLLKDFGYDTLTAPSAAAAFSAIEKRLPDLILLDIMIPDVDGFEVCRRLKNNPATKDVPVIFLTALNKKDHLVKGLNEGAVDFITKPFDVLEVAARINVHLELKESREQVQQVNNELSRRNTQYEEEINQASQFITSILPPPLTGKVACSSVFIPSVRLGGDTLNYFWLDDGHLVLYLLDVSGHGLVAALLSISLTNLLRSHALPGTDFTDPAAVLSALNARFPMEEQGGKYFTIWYGVYSPSSGVLTYCSAGHPPALLFRQANSFSTPEPLATRCNVIGVDQESKYYQASVPVSKGDRLYIYSDGTYELRHVDGTHFSHDEFVRLLAETNQLSPPLLGFVTGNLRAVQGKHYFEDDFTIVEALFS